MRLIMTKSSRRMDAIAGRSKWSATDRKCEECNGSMVKVGINEYACTKCGLKQRSEVKKKFTIRKYASTYTNYSRQIEKQWEGKNALTPTVYDKVKNIKPNKSNYIKPKLTKNKLYKCSKCNKKCKTQLSLDQHYKANHYEPNLAENKPLKCSKCNRRFKTQQSLDQHFEAKYYKSKRIDKRNIEFCDKCSNIMWISRKKDKLICRVCGQSKQISLND